MQRLRDEEIFPGDGGRSTWGKSMLKRVFRDPRTNKEENYYLFHSARVASIVLPLTTDKKVVAVRIFCQAANDFLLQLPGGVPKTGESFENAAIREVLEETGYTGGNLVPLGRGWFEPFNTTTPFQCFLLGDCERVRDPTEDSTEYLQVEVYSWEGWWSMCLDGVVEDAKSVLVTCRALGAMTAPM